MSYVFTPSTTGTTLYNMSNSDLRQLYSKVVELSEQEEDFWMQFEGRGEDSVIQTKTDTSKGAGQRIRFTNTTGFHMQGRFGEETFDSSEYYEQNRINGFDLTVDWIRNAARISKRAEEYMGLRGEIASKIPENLGKWLGREKSYRMDQLFLKRGQGRNTIYAGGKTSLDALTTSDILSYDEIVGMTNQVKRVGGKPGMVARVGRNAIKKYCLVATSDALLPLKKSSDYQNIARDSDVRGATNVLQQGGYIDLDGQVIKERDVLDHDGPGPIGSSMNPRALLGNAITAGTTALTLKGGGSTAWADLKHTPYFRCFPDFPVIFHTGDTIAAGTASFYVAIINPPDAATDPGKFGFYKCNANGWSSDVNVLTVEERLGAGSAGIANTQVGEVEWDADVNTAVHPVGATIILTNSSGVPIGYSFMLGSRAAYRGYGMYRRSMPVEQHEGSGPDAFIHERYIQSVFGQCLVKDVADRYPGYLTIAHAIEYAGDRLNPTLASS